VALKAAGRAYARKRAGTGLLAVPCTTHIPSHSAEEVRLGLQQQH